jgi:hypothetical protein
MGRSRIALLLVAALLAHGTGCRSSFRAAAPGPLSGPHPENADEAGASRTAVAETISEGPLKTAEAASESDSGVQLASAEEPAGAAELDLDRHDTATRRMIDEELRAATSQERNQLLDDLKGLQPAMVREVLKMRRLVREMGQDAPGRERVATTAEAERSPRPSVSDVQPVPAAAPAQDPAYTPPRSSAGLGSVDPWNDRGASGSAPVPAWGDGRRSFDGSGPAGDSDATTSNASSAWKIPAAESRPAAVGGPNRPSAYGHSTNAVPGAGTPVRSASYGAAGTGAGDDRAGRNGESQVPAQLAPYVPAAPIHPDAPPLVAAGPDEERAGAATYSGSALGETGSAAVSLPIPRMAAPAWEPELQRLVARAEADVAQLQLGAQPGEPEKRHYIESHVYLRMLYLMAGREERALAAIPGIDAADQEFWQQALWAIANYFDAEGIPAADDRATQTIAQLRTAIRRLQENARLELRNVTFCHKIASFGMYERFDRDEFSPGQPVLVYAEVANFTSEPAADGQFRTLLKSTVEIHTPAGELVERMAFPATEDLCRNYRRDYFHSYEFTIPQRIALGPHVLKLIVEDQLSRKTAEYTLNFSVR